MVILEYTDVECISDLPSSTARWLAVWHYHGLEHLYNLSEWDRIEVWQKISGSSKTSIGGVPPSLKQLLLRCRLSPLKQFEIYTFDANAEITYQQIKFQFDHDYDNIVASIRDRGNAIYPRILDTCVENSDAKLI